MRIRLPFAGSFFLLLLIAAWLGLTPVKLSGVFASSDKLLHFTTFFLLTLVFYWVLDTSKRRAINLTLSVCTGALGVGSEFVQSFLPNDRDFDMLDIFANVGGSLLAVALCSWYHRRMLDRKRARRRGGGGAVLAGDDDDDVELALTAGQEGSEQDDGGAEAAAAPAAAQRPGGARTLEDEVDTWDENAVDSWDGGEDGGAGRAPRGRKASAAEGADLGDGKQRAD